MTVSSSPVHSSSLTKDSWKGERTDGRIWEESPPLTGNAYNVRASRHHGVSGTLLQVSNEPNCEAMSEEILKAMNRDTLSLYALPPHIAHFCITLLLTEPNYETHALLEVHMGYSKFSGEKIFHYSVLRRLVDTDHLQENSQMKSYV